jgi:hypothetical protein
MKKIREKVNGWTDVIVFGLVLTTISVVAVVNISTAGNRVTRQESWFPEHAKDQIEISKVSDPIKKKQSESFFEGFFVDDEDVKKPLKGQKKTKVDIEQDVEEDTPISSLWDEMFISDSDIPDKSTKKKSKKVSTDNEKSWFSMVQDMFVDDENVKPVKEKRPRQVAKSAQVPSQFQEFFGSFLAQNQPKKVQKMNSMFG